MKPYQWILFVLLNASILQSCSVTGLLVGAIGDVSAPHDQKESVYKQGWNSFTRKDTEIELLLQDDSRIKGSFIREYLQASKTDSILMILIKSRKGYQYIQASNIKTTTRYSKRETNHKKTGFTIGLVVDLIFVLTILAAENSDTCIMLCDGLDLQIK